MLFMTRTISFAERTRMLLFIECCSTLVTRVIRCRDNRRKRKTIKESFLSTWTFEFKNVDWLMTMRTGRRQELFVWVVIVETFLSGIDKRKKIFRKNNIVFSNHERRKGNDRRSMGRDQWERKHQWTQIGIWRGLFINDLLEDRTQ